MKFTEYTPTQSDNDSKSQWLKFKEGENTVRIVSDPEPLVQHFIAGKPIMCIEGCKQCDLAKEFWANPENKKKQNPYRASHKYVMWAIDRTDKEFKIMSVGNKIMDALSTYANDPEWKFNSNGLPDYDVKIIKEVKGAALSDITYKVLPKKESALTKEELAEIKKLTPLSEIIANYKKINDKPSQQEEASLDEVKAEIEEDIHPEDLPF